MHGIIARIASESESDHIQMYVDNLPLLPKYLKDHDFDPIVVASVLGVPTAWGARSDLSRNQTTGDASMMDKLMLELSELVESASVASSNPDKMPQVEEKLTTIAAVCVRMLDRINRR